ncbi:PQQ-binding-like beta-propeller repeat protein [Belliella sp. R4-6]|uniref:PQQ-binding-like beta-propeller repeat protein n=1 Tax=Belliella alkalica TaxID=1730871 RepID=A0ABS9V9I6_9BACT|nr:PQQ-binding-like beta-propeller repeat protein [Belliella alkalica]MCH7413092.1 PQQ-binding-like beta-propeller repeat protein [Belliella alkalica]
MRIFPTKFTLTISMFFLALGSYAQDFKFALVTDIHIGSPNGVAEEDLQRTVDDINKQPDLDFVLLTGDITEMGTEEEIATAKSIIIQLNIPYYIIPGNHDTGWSESGGVGFIQAFGDDKFVFEHKGYKFIGTSSGPYVRMSDGHIPRDAVVWMDSVLHTTPKDQPIINVNHYPLDKALDNWYEATDRLKQYNVQFSVCGHGHTNKVYDFEGIPGIMSRSNLRAKDEVGGYQWISIKSDTAYFQERNPGVGTKEVWHKIALGKREFDVNQTFERPSFEINGKYPNVEKKWSYHSDANVISTPAYTDGKVIFGNAVGKIEALDKETGEVIWSFDTDGGIFSSSVISNDLVILGSGDGNVYGLELNSGKLIWKKAFEKSVLGSPEIYDDLVLVGGSDGTFRALDSKTGKEKWVYDGIGGPVVSKPLIDGGMVVFGAWDRHLYALDIVSGNLLWKWDNGSPNRMYSPAMCIPVAHDGVIYIVAPDRFLTAIDAESGETLWRTNEATVRESIGISADGRLIYGKTMNDEIVAFETGKSEAKLAWRMDCGFGYEHVPSMLIEHEDKVYFGTKSGVVYSIDPKNQQIIWAHKVDNSMVNTVNVISDTSLIVATMDGKVEWLEF